MARNQLPVGHDLFVQDNLEDAAIFQMPVAPTLEKCATALVTVVQRDGRADWEGWLSVFLTGAMQICSSPIVLNNHCTIEDMADAELSANGRIGAIKGGFVILCNAIKPIVAQNKEYVRKRWTTAEKTLKEKGVKMPGWGEGLDGVSEERLFHEETLTASIRYIRLDKVPVAARGVVEGQVVGGGPILAALRDQIAMIYHGAGMTSIELMHDYVLRPTNPAIALPAVCEEALQFSKAYNGLKEKFGGAFLYLRSIAPQFLNSLDISKFPTLYWVAVESAKREGKLGPNKGSNYAMSGATPKISTEQMEKYVRRSLSVVDTVTPNVAKTLQALGLERTIPGLERILEKMRGRKRKAPVSESESSDESL